jgi:hypothetical protein
MTRSRLLIAAIVGLSLILYGHPHPQVAYAQSRTGTDTIRFVGSKQGFNWDGQGDAWCWVRQDAISGTGWHGLWNNALDEVAQTGPFVSGAGFATYCPSVNDAGQPVAPQVDFRVFAQTDNPQCTALSPCASLYVVGRSGTYSDPNQLCTYIEAALYDYDTYGSHLLPAWAGGRQTTGDWKGKLRMIHARGSDVWRATIVATQGSWNVNDTVVGTVQADPPACSTNYHVH